MSKKQRIIRVAIDGNEANAVDRVGSNVYAYEILKNMEEITRVKRKNFQVTVFLASEPQPDMPLPRDGWRYQVVGPKKAWTQFGLPLYLFIHQKEYDIFYTPGHYAPRWCALPYVSSVMDLAFIKYPELFRPHDLYQLVNWTRYSVERAQTVVCISEFTKKQVMSAYGKKANEVMVAYPAFAGKVKRLSLATQKQVLSDLHITGPYLLYLGTLQPRKNIVRMVEAFEIMVQKEKFNNYKLVLAGKNGWLTGEIEEKIKNSSVAERIILTGFVSETQKRALLSGATATLNLGFYEGFGIPALESLAYGTMPIVANNTSLLEVVGMTGLGVNPYHTESIAKAMSAAASMSVAQKAKFLRLAPKQVEKFSYRISADKILNLLSRIARSTRV